MGIISKLRRARQLSPAQWLLLLQATALLWRAAWMLRSRSLPAMLSWAEGVISREKPRFAPAEISELVAIAVCSAMPEGSCLPQSLVTARLLKREGHRASLVIGTKAARGQAAGKHVVPFSAHAWVEVPRPGASDPPIVFHRGDHEELVRFSKSA